MKIEVRAPSLGESISEATISNILKANNSQVKKGDIILEVETEKVTLEVTALQDGIISDMNLKVGDIIKANDFVCNISPSSAPIKEEQPAKQTKAIEVQEEKNIAPSASKLAHENNINTDNINGSGKRGQILKEDILSYLNNDGKAIQSQTVQASRVEKIKMSKLRQTIAKRLKDSQNTAAILTTFNEVDMYEVMNIRKKYKDSFEKKYGVKLGMMSFFVKAAVEALSQIPAINAEVNGDEIIYKNYYDIGVAVGTEQGLVVPVLRDCDKMSMSDIEKSIVDYGKKAKEGKLAMSDMQGGTFTISNGGVYGSMLSTPIINPPQSGILGLHNIVERPVVVNGEIVIRPIMYLALSYDHRIVDGKEAVTFLVKIKQMIEDPSRLLMGI
jgi:2-oxoglutarate dehydrogenase E2 component (dihydrolipoamide succinyltransferase)